MRSLIFSLILTSSYFAVSQDMLTVRLLDYESGKPIKNALIKYDDDSTFSNFLGYFQCHAEIGDSLFVSHNSYKRSIIEVPSAKNFNVQLQRNYFDLGNLKLNIPPEIEDDDAKRISEKLETMGFLANYQGGLKKLYFDLKKSIDEKEIINDEFSLYVKFTVNEKGEVMEIFVSDTTIRGLDRIYSKLRSNNWNIGYQNNLPSSQYFSLMVSNSKEKFAIVEDPAMPPDGYRGFYSYISKNLKYPKEARRKKVEGKVYIQFVVNKKGELEEIEIHKGLGYGCDEEAIRLIQNSPLWTPPKQKGIPVKQRIILPIIFKL